MSRSRLTYCVSSYHCAQKPQADVSILAEAWIGDWLQNGLSQNPPNGLGLDVKSVGRETNCRAREFQLLTVKWMTPTDLDVKGIYQFRMRTLDLETISEPFRLEDTPESLVRVRELQAQGMALASDSRQKNHHTFIGIAALVLGLVALAWAAAYVYKVRRARAAARRAKATDLTPFHDDAVYADVEVNGEANAPTRD